MKILLAIAGLIAVAHTGVSDGPVVKIIHTTPPIDSVTGYIDCPKDQDMFLTCEGNNLSPHLEVTWVAYLDDNTRSMTISTDTTSVDPFKYRVTRPTPKTWRLQVQNLQVSDTGRYRCQVRIGIQSYVSDEVGVIVSGSP